MGPLMIIGAVPLYNIFSVIVLTFEAGDDGEKKDMSRLRQATINILKNPIIIAIALGLFVAYFQIDFPTIVDNTVNNIAKMATPLALIGMGAGFEGRKAMAKIRPTIAASLIKLVAQPLIFIPLAVALGFTGEKLIGILVMLAAPATPSCYIMAKNMKNDGVLTASIVVTTTLFAAFTLKLNRNSPMHIRKAKEIILFVIFFIPLFLPFHQKYPYSDSISKVPTTPLPAPSFAPLIVPSAFTLGMAMASTFTGALLPSPIYRI